MSQSPPDPDPAAAPAPRGGRAISPWLRQALELGPTILFFLAYLRIREQSFSFGGTEYSGFIVATLLFIPVLLVAMGALWALTGELSRMQAVTAAMVVLFGGLTAWFNDERFFKVKTTIVYGLFAAILGIGLLTGRSLLEWVMGAALPMRREGWTILTRRLALIFLGLAAANEAVWRTQPTETWVAVETFGFPLLLLVLLWVQILALRPYMTDEG